MLAVSLFAGLLAGSTFAQNTVEKGENDAPKEQRPAPPKIGETAPTFTLSSLDGKNTTDLKSYRGKRPVILIFGSYT